MASALPGELMMVGFDGLTVSPELSDWITKKHVGGVVLFQRNMALMPQEFKLIHQMQQLRSTVSAQPLFIAVDQEGGAVSRFMPGMTVLPGNMALGAIGTEDSAYAAGRITAVEMGMLGFNLNLAPVLDVSVDPENLVVGVRSFGQDPRLAGRMGAAMIDGLQSNGMMATAKHFPGLGHSRADPHSDLPIVVSSEGDILGQGVPAFTLAIAAGVEMVMTAHVVFRCWEQGLVPATLSERILSGLLRERLGFKGLVISDDLEMAALTKYFSIPEIVTRSIKAGVDILLSCHSREKQAETYAALEQNFQEGGAPAARMARSLQRVQEAKERLMKQSPAMPFGIKMLGTHAEVSERMGRDAVTLLRDEGGLVPIRLDRRQKILVLAPKYENVTQAVKIQVEESPQRKGHGHEDIPTLLQLFRALHANTDLRRFDVSPPPQGMAALSDCRSYDLIVLLTYNAHLFPPQMEFARRLLAQKKEVIVAAIRNPYDLQELQEASTALATYGFRDCSLRGLVQALFGEAIPNGKMPVKLGSSAGDQP